MGNIHTNYSKSDSEELDLRSLFILIYGGKWTIFFSTLLASILIVFYSLSIPNVYTSYSLLAPAQTSSQSSAFDRITGLASVGGINLQSSEGSLTDEAIATIKSLKFFKNNFLPNIFLPNLFAIEEWNMAKNNIIYNKNIFDIESKKWLRNAKPPKTSQPSAQEGYRAFLNGFEISQDDKNGYVTIKITHQSPVIAQKWNEIIIYQINMLTRDNAKLQVTKSINFLNLQLSQTNLSEVKEALANILEQETKKLMLIESNSEYVFKVIEPPYAPEIKSSPSRALICIIGAFMGFMIGIFIVLVKNFREKQ